MLIVGIFSLLVFFVSLMLFFIKFFRKKKVKVTLVVTLITFAIAMFGIAFGSQAENAEKKDVQKSEQSRDESKKVKLSDSQLDEYYKTFDEIVKANSNDDISTLVADYSVKQSGDSLISVNVIVHQDIKYLSESKKQVVADQIGQVYYGAATGSLYAVLKDNEALSVDVKLHYSEDDGLFAENRMIMNPKEFKVKN